jgi:hypothetical protein
LDRVPRSHARTPPQALCKGADRDTDCFDVRIGEGRKGSRLEAMRRAFAGWLRQAVVVEASQVSANLLLSLVQLTSKGVGESFAAYAKGVAKKRAQPGEGGASGPCTELTEHAMSLEANLQPAMRVDGACYVRKRQEPVEVRAAFEERG